MKSSQDQFADSRLLSFMSSTSLLLPDFEPRRFRSTASHYVRGRLAYPFRLIQRVAQRVKIEREHRILDLGCGPGFLAVAFGRLAGEVLGVDPEPEMLAVAQEYAAQNGSAAIFRKGSSYDLKPDFGKFRLTAMGRSFHWMDRATTLDSLHALTEPGGAVAIFRDRHLRVPENAWKEEFDSFFDALRESDSARDIERGSGPKGQPHESVLLQSPFSNLERISVIQRLSTPIDLLIDRALSYSVASPERLGDGQDDFIARLQEFLVRQSSDRVITEVVETEALLAFRPDEG
jgi:SAM-dependent methyltransferase